MWEVGGVETVPVECVHVVIEVRSRLDAPALRETWDKLTRLKRFPKTAFIPLSQRSAVRPAIYAYGKQWDYFPTHVYVFAFENIRLDHAQLHTLSDRPRPTLDSP